MKFAITATDRFLGVFEAFVNAGWTPLKLFTVPMSHPLSSQQAVIAYAGQHHAAVQLSPMSDRDMAELRDLGCQVLIVASYDWKIGDWQAYLPYAINFHSSPLPIGRGPYPAFRAILEQRTSWAVTCHRVTARIDAGDILASDEFALQPDVCHEALDLKIQMSAKRLANRVAHNFEELWQQARPQVLAPYWPKPALCERVIDFQQPVEQILRHIRAYGATETLAHINNSWFVVKRAVGWREAHPYVTGYIPHVFFRSIVVTAADGYIGLLDCEQVPVNVAEQMEAEVRAGK